MSGQSFIQVRVDNDIKLKANQIFDEMGIDMPTAIRMFLKRTILHNGLPFDINLPSGVTTPYENNKMTVTHIPAKPSKTVSVELYLKLLCCVPAGKVTRYDDIISFLQKLYQIDIVKLDYDPHAYMYYDESIPYWRELSTRGQLEDKAVMTHEKQQQKLEEEGFSIIPCGAYKRSLKVENYKDYLFDFGSINIAEVCEL